MSVLNQMLRDLESRGADAEAAAQAVPEPSVPAAPIVRPLAIAREGHASRLIRIAAWGGVAILVAATGISYAWYAQHLNELARAPQPLGLQQFAAVAVPPTVSKNAIAIAPAPVRSETAAPTPVAKAAAAPIETPSKHAAERSTIAGATPSVRSGPRLDSRKAATSASAPGNESPAAAAAVEPQSPTPVPAAPAIAATAPAPPASSADNAVIVSRPSNPGAALEARATDLIARGRSAEAMSLLAQVVQQSPANSTARATLAALQAETGRRDLALQTLLAGSQIEPARFAAPAAQLQAALGEPAAALATLDRVPESARNAAHEALAGGLAQRAGEHRRAVDAFQRALRAPSAPPVWWAGLAVSLEALDQPAAALAAFKRAAADPSLPAATRSYALHRISALSTAPSVQAPALEGTLVSAKP